MSRFRKKPIEVEAYQITEKKEIQTREGTLYGYPGDWIVTGIQGEIYPVGKEIFEATYEPVGCASHSSAASRREQVLDELMNKVGENEIFLQTDSNGFEVYVITRKELNRVVAELRQHAEVQR